MLTEHAEGEQRHVDVTEAVEDVVDELVVPAGVGRIERHGLDARDALRAELLDEATQLIRVACRQHRRVKARRKPSYGREGNLGRRAEHEQ